jgi:hypothetical protein
VDRERLDFDALQQRMVSTAGSGRRRLGPAQPASLVALDVLAVGSVDVRPMRWTARRQRLDSLAGSWVPPLQLSPVTSDVDEGMEWLEAGRGKPGEASDRLRELLRITDGDEPRPPRRTGPTRPAHRRPAGAAATLTGGSQLKSGQTRQPCVRAHAARARHTAATGVGGMHR